MTRREFLKITAGLAVAFGASRLLLNRPVAGDNRLGNMNPQLIPGVTLAPQLGGSWQARYDGNYAFTVNAEGRDVLKLMDGGNDIDQIVHAFAKSHNVSEEYFDQVRSSVVSFIAEFAQAGYLHGRFMAVIFEHT